MEKEVKELETRLRVRRLIDKVKETPSLTEKATLMQEMGDIRYNAYRETGNANQRKLAANCYIASRRFQYRLA